MEIALASPASYAFSVHSLLTLLTALAVLLLGVLVVARERRSSVSLAFFALTLVVGVWLFAFSLVYAATGEQVAHWWVRVAYLGIPAIGPAIYGFTVVELGLYPRHHKAVWLGWLLAAVFSAAVWWTDALVAGLYAYWWGYYPRFGWLGAPFIAFICATLLASLGRYWGAYRAAAPGVDKRRIGALMGAFAVGYVAVVDFVAVYGVPLYPFGYLAVLGFVLLSARAIWRYRLVELTPAFAAPQIVATMSDALFVLDRDGVVRLTNPAGCALLGLPQERVLGARLSAIIGPGAPAEQLDRLAGAGAVRALELTYRPGTGDERILSLSASAIPDAYGQPAGAVWTARDVTAARRAEAEIRRLNEDLERRVRERTAELEAANRELEREIGERRRAEEARAQLLARERRRARQLRRLAEAFLLVSSAPSPAEILQVIGRQAREIIGADWAVVSLVPDRGGTETPRAVSLSDKYAAVGHPGRAEHADGADVTALLRAVSLPIRLTQAELEAHPAWPEIRRAAGPYLPPRGWLAAPLTGDDGRILGLIELSDPGLGDFTTEDEAILVQLGRMASVELEKARLYHEAREAVVARETLLWIVSHDLGNLLASIGPSVELLQRVLGRPGPPNVERIAAGLARIETVTIRMHNLIGELLDFGRLQAGQPLVLQRRPTDLVALARELAAQHQQASPRHRIRVEAAVPELVGLWDTPRLERVLDNLLSNATKYMPDGGEIRVELAREELEEPWARLAVRDRGVGIPASDLPYIFDWFRRAGNVAGRIGGTGIGLAGARQVVEQHGGRIGVASEEGRGSTFTVWLPLTTLEDQGIAPLAAHAPPSGDRATRP